jgi:hypothetical protein
MVSLAILQQDSIVLLEESWDIASKYIEEIALEQVSERALFL